MRLTFPVKVIRIDRTINNDYFFVMLDTLQLSCSIKHTCNYLV